MNEYNFPESVKFQVVSGRNYEEGMIKLQIACSSDPNNSQPYFNLLGQKIYRPLTMKELMKAALISLKSDIAFGKVHDPSYQGGSMISGFDPSLQFTSCTAMALNGEYKSGNANDERFKIVPMSLDLLTVMDGKLHKLLEEGNERYALPVNYSVIKSRELKEVDDSYGNELGINQAKHHEGWVACAEDDQAFLELFMKAQFSKLKLHKGMGFGKSRSAGISEVLALSLQNMVASNLFCYPSELSEKVAFLRVSRG